MFIATPKFLEVPYFILSCGLWINTNVPGIGNVCNVRKILIFVVNFDLWSSLAKADAYCQALISL